MQGHHVVCGHLMNLSFSKHISAIHNVEIERMGNIGMYKNMHQVAINQTKPRVHIHAVVPTGAQIWKKLVISPKSGPKLIKIERSGLFSIIFIPIHMQNLEVIDGEKTTENALIETRAQHVHIVLCIHVQSILILSKAWFRVSKMTKNNDG